MTTLIEQFDAYAHEQIAELNKKCSYLTASRRMHDALKCLNRELPHKRALFTDKHNEIVELLATQKEDDLEKALNIFYKIVGRSYTPALEFVNHRLPSSPRSRIRMTQKRRIMNSGGPIHPNLLSKRMKNTKGVRTEFRRNARLTLKK